MWDVAEAGINIKSNWFELTLPPALLLTWIWDEWQQILQPVVSEDRWREKETEDEKEDEKRAGRLGGTINQSISQATDLFQFHPRMPSHICGTQHRHRQSINQPGADLQFGLQSLFRIFTHRPNWGFSVRQPTSRGILRCNRRIVGFGGSLVLGRAANKIEGKANKIEGHC